MLFYMPIKIKSKSYGTAFFLNRFFLFVLEKFFSEVLMQKIRNVIQHKDPLILNV